MDKFPNKYILTIKPNEYLQQGPSHCGAFSVKAILSAYGLDTKDEPKYYHPNWVGRLTGLTLGRNYYVNILKKNGIEAELKTAEGNTIEEIITLLKEILNNNTPVMIRIGNGYMTDKYNLIIGRLAGHWITIWGYDNDRQFFYIYDSALPKQYWNKNLPIGNTTRKYSEILRDWKFGKWQVYYWLLSGKSNYTYIKIKKPNAL
ncbi:conserved hypothetical protein [Candidatus Roizmanbacteria bacterium]|nr:conserved hypothetical protein [Candidatus Roizmanbacteria bacterium]